jgi:hypothetical protein
MKTIKEEFDIIKVKGKSGTRWVFFKKKEKKGRKKKESVWSILHSLERFRSCDGLIWESSWRLERTRCQSLKEKREF